MTPPTHDTAHSRLCDCDMHTPHAQLTPPLRLMRRVCLQIPSRGIVYGGNAESRRSWSTRGCTRRGAIFTPSRMRCTCCHPCHFICLGWQLLERRQKGRPKWLGLGRLWAWPSTSLPVGHRLFGRHCVKLSHTEWLIMSKNGNAAQ
jgi:hypothetical protein